MDAERRIAELESELAAKDARIVEQDARIVEHVALRKLWSLGSGSSTRLHIRASTMRASARCSFDKVKMSPSRKKRRQAAQLHDLLRRTG